MPSHSSPDEPEIRAVIRRVVEGLLDDATAADSSPDRAPAPAPEPPPADASPGSERIAIGADHGGFKLKEELVVKLGMAGYQVDDCGPSGPEPVDYPDYAHVVAKKVAAGECEWGIMIDGAGIGSAMVANKVPGVRAALCYDLSSARNSREHNHANVLTLGAGLIGAALAWQIVQEWLSVPWGGDRHARRVGLITEVEHTYLAARS